MPEAVALDDNAIHHDRCIQSHLSQHSYITRHSILALLTIYCEPHRDRLLGNKIMYKVSSTFTKLHDTFHKILFILPETPDSLYD